jgi:hypothetical protein
VSCELAFYGACFYEQVEKYCIFGVKKNVGEKKFNGRDVVDL